VVLKALSRVFRPQALQPIVGDANGYTQRVRLEPDVLSHVCRHRQTSARATEAGGQLFGTLDEYLVRVVCATGPYAGDERSRYRYRSNSAAAQRAVEAQSIAGRLYLGEWHTHAEDHPSASSLDSDAMTRVIASSTLNSNSLLMLIVGRAVGFDGLALLTVSKGSTLAWALTAVDDSIAQRGTIRGPS
jgi:integrative and conjugative element protein (TIGR02256 family)